MGPFYRHGLTLFQALISNHVPCKLWCEIIQPFPNFNVCTDDVWEWISDFHTAHYNEYDNLSMPGLT